jgi:N-acetyl sugar amidotransferase
MDSSDPDISFDEHGVCNHCHHYDRVATKRLVPLSERAEVLKKTVEQIKRDGKGKPYDCVIGVSGGVDSTYVAYLTRELGLRPLAVHFDNGWNSELAVANIEKTLRTLRIDLQTYVVDWPEFRDLQLSFLKASTPDGEVPTDHAIVALLYQTAIRLNIKTILLGVNVASESIMPLKWGYGYSDFRYIKSVQKKFGSMPLKTYPHYSLPQLFYYMKIKAVRLVPILDLVDYQKEEVMQLIQDKLGWIYYGGKHYESIYTRFYQSYVLPVKFGIDKRRAHYSNLVLSGQLTRPAAEAMLKVPPCSIEQSDQDKTYVIKKFGITDVQFSELMSLPLKNFMSYPNSFERIELAKKFLRK